MSSCFRMQVCNMIRHAPCVRGSGLAHRAIRLCLGLSLAVSVGQAAPDIVAPSGLLASWTDDPIAIDGRLVEQAWHKAATAERFFTLGSQDAAPEQTSVRVLTDGRNLFLGFRCIEPAMTTLVATERARDDQTFLDDSVEVFIDPDNGRRRLFQFVANAAGSVFDTSATISGHTVKDDRTWNGEWRVATNREKNAWSAEFAIPLVVLGVREPFPATLGVNLCRNRAQAAQKHSSWSPCEAAFCEPGSLGSLTLPNASGEFLQVDVASAAWQITGQPLSPLDVRSDFSRPLRVRCAYRLEGRGMSVQSGLTGETTVPARGRTRISLPAMPLTAGSHRLTVHVEEAGSRTRLGTLSRDLEAAPAMEVALRPFALYAHRAEATVFLRTDDPSYSRANVTVQLMRGRDSIAGRVVEIAALAKRQANVSLDLRGLPAGEYCLKAELRTRQGQTSLSAVSAPMSYEPDPKIGIDANGILELESKPFFPIGMYTLQDRDGNHDSVLAEAREAGFNTTVYYAFTTATIQPLLDAAGRNGVHAFVYVTDPYRLRTGKSTRKEILTDLQARRNHPALLGWYLVDEPEGIGESDPRTIREFYETVKGADMHHPCSLVVMSPAAAKRYCDFADIAWIDPYPVPDRPVTFVSECIEGVRKVVGEAKPVWAVLQAFDWNVWRHGAIRDEHRPTPAEERCMTYLALVHGAKGIIYWAHTASKYYIRDYPDHWKTMKQLAGELRELTPVLLAPPEETRLRVSPQKAPVDWMLRKHDASLYVFAVNRETTPTQASFSLDKGIRATTAEVLFENRSVPLNRGTWMDTFQPLEVHVYRLGVE